MTSDSILKREGDGKLFRVAFLSHWSDIIAVDGSGEKFSVKWLGGDEYVGTSGPRFRLEKAAALPDGFDGLMYRLDGRKYSEFAAETYLGKLGFSDDDTITYMASLKKEFTARG